MPAHRSRGARYLPIAAALTFLCFVAACRTVVIVHEPVVEVDPCPMSDSTRHEAPCCGEADGADAESGPSVAMNYCCFVVVCCGGTDNEFVPRKLDDLKEDPYADEGGLPQ